MKPRLSNRLRSINTAFAVLLLVIAPFNLAFSEAPQLPTAPALPTSPAVVNITPVAPELPGAPTLPTLPNANSSDTDTAGDPNNQPSITETIPNTSADAPPSTTVVDVPIDLDNESDTALVPSLLLGEGLSISNPEVSNENTGAESNDNSLIPDSNSTTVNNTNNAKLSNVFNISSDTGDNGANYNTGDGSVKTGDSNIILSILNLINTTFVALPGGEIKFLFENIAGSLFGNYLVDPLSGETYALNGSRVATNNDTGAGSTNSAIINTNNSTTLNNSNNADLDNNYNISSNTGDNTASYNTGDGSITTGGSNISLNLLNFINSSFTATNFGLVGVLNVFGDWLGDLLLPKSLVSGLASSGSGDGSLIVENDITGSDSNNLASLTTSNALDIDNDNNADILNNINIANNTGDNTSGYNTGSGLVDTGDTNTKLSIDNIANQNIIGDTVFFFLINVAGEWIGTNFLSSGLGIVNTGCGTGCIDNISATNSETGAESDNTAIIDTSNNLDINNLNDGALSNNITIDANTGDNKTAYNTGNGNITTGDSNILANIANVMNVNVVAKKFVFLIVNVFGNWNGNIDVKKDTEDVAITAENVAKVPTEVYLTTVPAAVSFYKYFEPQVTADHPSYSDQNVAVRNTNTGADSENNTIVLAANTDNSSSSGNILGVSTVDNKKSSTGILDSLRKYTMQILILLTIIYLSFLSVYFKRKKRI